MKNLLRIIGSIGVSLVVLCLLLHTVTKGLPEQEKPDILAALQNTSIKLLIAYLGIYLITLLIRAYRYRLLIALSGETNVPTMKQMALVTGIRNMFVDMLPARLGELGYLGLLNKGYNVKLQHCASSLAISIALDFIALMVVVLIIIALQIIGSGVQAWALAALLVTIVLSAVALLGLFVITPLMVHWLRNSFVMKGWQQKVFALLEQFSSSLTSVKQSGQAVKVVSLSVTIRFLKYLSLYLLFIAVAKPSFSSLATLPTGQIVSALIGGEVASSLPIPTFMSFGAYEAGGALVFQFLDVVNQANAVMTLLCTHIWSQFIEYSLGGIMLIVFIMTTRSSFREITTKQ